MKKFQLSDYKKGFILSLGLHVALVAAFVFEEFAKTPPPPPAQKSISLSLNSFTPAPQAAPTPQPQTPPKPKVCKEKKPELAKKPKHHKKHEHHAKKRHHKKDAPRKVQELVEAKEIPQKETLQKPVEEIVQAAPQEVTQETTEVAEATPQTQSTPAVQTPPPPSAAELEEEFAATNFEIIRALVLQNLTYPSLAKRMHQTGIVEILLVINEKGKLIDVSLENSSGYKLLDKSAIKAAHLLADLELPVPKNTSRIVLPIAFALN